MIATAPLRAAIRSAAGEDMVVDKATLAELLDAVESGQRAERALRNAGAIAGSVGIGGVSAAAA